MTPRFFEALNLWVRCRGRFFSRKIAPVCLEAPNLWVRCGRRFFLQKNGPHIFGSPSLVSTSPQAFFFVLRKMAPIRLEAPNQEIRRVPLPGVSRSEGWNPPLSWYELKSNHMNPFRTKFHIFLFNIRRPPKGVNNVWERHSLQVGLCSS